MLPTKNKTCLALALALVATSCATGPDGRPVGFQKTVKDTFASDDPCANNARNIGIVGGAVVGVLLARAVGKGPGLMVGAGVGALLGGLIGADMDRRRCELTQVAKAHHLDIVMTDIAFAPAAVESSSSGLATGAARKPEPVGMSLSIVDHGEQFAVGSSVPSPDAVKAFGAVADRYLVPLSTTDSTSLQTAAVRNKQMRILLVGHTDDTGASAQNAQLSEERAQAVARIFAQHGFNTEQLFYQGAGEVFPMAANDTEAGRARNRRVEIVDLSDDAAFSTFLASRRPDVAHYRAAPEIKPRAELVAQAGPAPLKTPTPNQRADRTSTKAANVALAPSPAGVTKTAAPPAATSTASLNLDLGGHPAQGPFRAADIGKPARANLWGLISPAYASQESPVRSCATDRPRISRGVKSLGTGEVLKTSDYLPGTANTSWAGKANGHLVGLTGVSVLRDGAQPANSPQFLIWKNFVEGSGARSDFKTTADVNAYEGDKALLYRVFLSHGPVRCVDLVIPRGAAHTAPTSSLIYEHNSALYQADFSPAIVR